MCHLLGVLEPKKSPGIHPTVCSYCSRLPRDLRQCFQGADSDPVLDGVLVLGVPGGGAPLDHHDALGPLQIRHHQGILSPFHLQNYFYLAFLGFFWKHEVEQLSLSGKLFFFTN